MNSDIRSMISCACITGRPGITCGMKWEHQRFLGCCKTELCRQGVWHKWRLHLLIMGFGFRILCANPTEGEVSTWNRKGDKPVDIWLTTSILLCGDERPFSPKSRGYLTDVHINWKLLRHWLRRCSRLMTYRCSSIFAMILYHRCSLVHVTRKKNRLKLKLFLVKKY